MTKKQYIQFSKKVVIAVCVAVTSLTVCGVVLCFLAGEMHEAVQVIKVYIQYAMVVFAAYSGNSAVEKWLTKRWGSVEARAEKQDDSEG